MHRLFAAIRPPETAIDALIDTMEGLDSARWQSDEQLHLTLRFIGEVDRHRAEDVADALSAIRFAPFEVTISSVGHFERKGRPFALWAGIESSPPLTELQKKVEAACRRVGLEAETRKYLPHITLARLNASSGDIGAWLARHAALRLPPFEVSRFALFESHLSSGGSIYRQVADFGG